MARSIFLTLGASLALFSAQTHAKDKTEGLRLYAFASDDCNGPPIGGNLDIKQEKCFNLVSGGAQSIRPMSHKGITWIKNVNSGAADCALISYKQFGCVDEQVLGGGKLPCDLGGCVASYDGQQTLSVLFTCNAKKLKCLDVLERDVLDQDLPQTTIVETRTYTGESTSWRPVGPDAWTPVVATATYTVPTTIETVVRPSLITVGQIHGRDIVTVTVDHEEPTETIYEYSSEKRLAPREDQSQELDDGDLDDGDLNDSEPDCEGDDCPEPSTDLDPRNKGKWKGPRKGVWMKHPWSMSIMCYECYTKSKTNIQKFECRAGPKNPAYCGPMPEQGTLTTVTIFPIETVTVTPGVHWANIQKRSWHKRVSFPHPWYPGTTMCADAEWEKRGQKKAEIRLQKPKTKICTDALDIAIAPHVTTVIGPVQTLTVTLPLPTTVYTVLPPVLTTSTIYPLTTSCTTLVGAPTSTTTVVVPSTPTITVTVQKSTTTVTVPPPSTTTVTVEESTTCSTVGWDRIYPPQAPGGFTTVYVDPHQAQPTQVVYVTTQVAQQRPVVYVTAYDQEAQVTTTLYNMQQRQEHTHTDL